MEEDFHILALVVGGASRILALVMGKVSWYMGKCGNNFLNFRMEKNVLLKKCFLKKGGHGTLGKVNGHLEKDFL